jgi:hypothetical protein
MVVRLDQMVIQLDEGLLNPLFGYPYQLSHQDHKRKEYLCHDSSKFMGEKDVPPPQDGKNEEQTTGNHEKDQNSKG